MAKREAKVNVEQVHEKAIANIFDVLSGKKDFDERTQLAMKYLNYESRAEQLRHGRQKLAFTMVRAMSDPEAVRKYVTATEPVIKRLTA